MLKNHYLSGDNSLDGPIPTEIGALNGLATLDIGETISTFLCIDFIDEFILLQIY